MKTVSKVIHLGLTAAAFTYFACSQTAQALLPSPTPDGAYPGWNTAEGSGALFNVTTGGFNTAIGGHALYGNTSQNANTAVGAFALTANNPGNQNVAVGQAALRNNTGSSGNVAIGFQGLLRNTTGEGNTAVGYQALYSNTTGYSNTANGYQALYSNTTGFSNVATGIVALSNNTTGFDNTATGSGALDLNTTGSNNTANGFDALLQNTTGNNNTACGVEALLINVANNNTATGFQALSINTTGNNNTADGVGALSTNNGSNNIAVGVNAGLNLTTGNNNIDIGNMGVMGESGKIRIGTVGTQNATFVAGVDGVAVTGSAVLVSSTGQLGVAASSARFKERITPMDKASEALLALKPVAFRYKKDLDPNARAQFGLIAEQVEKIDPDLVSRDADGKAFSVRYDAVNAMLLNEFLKAHRKIEEQETAIVQLKSNDVQQQQEIKALAATVKEQQSRIEKVSAQLELANRHRKTVLNNR